MSRIWTRKYVKNVANNEVKNAVKKLGQEWGHNNVVDNKAKKEVMIEIKKIR